MRIWIDIGRILMNFPASRNVKEVALPHIEISDSDFNRLKGMAEPFVDTPATVISKLLDWYESRLPGDKIEESMVRALPVHLTDIPPLTHAKFLDGRFEGQIPARKTWDGLLFLALTTALDRLKSIDELRRVSGANIRSGGKDDEGYKFAAQYGFSYQGVSAEDAMRIVRRICRYFKMRCDLEFEWRDKDGAFLPGRRAEIHITGSFVNGGVA